VAGWFLEGADPVIKVSILPRSKGALGFAQNLPSETMLVNEQELKDKICMILGGRVSELLFFGTVTNGASDDLKKATQLAQALTENFGMSKNAGLVSYSLNERYYSENTKDLIDREVKNVIDECLEKTKELLGGKRELITKLAERLIAAERLTHRDLVDILGPRPFEESDEYKRYILEQKMDVN
jgi:AFG3 family protein